MESWLDEISQEQCLDPPRLVRGAQELDAFLLVSAEVALNP